ncbi:MAG: RNA polymerase sigma-I factor [Tissierellia bacterium]|nr:RNA polymerase sigma-I factor [Tissierellia bacterium]
MKDKLLDSIFKAKSSLIEADKLIRKYLPFIKSESSKLVNRHISEGDDELSIAMIGFHEAIKSYELEKGNFISFASTIMKNRIIDYYRAESRHINQLSIEEELNGNKMPLEEKLSSHDRNLERLEINIDLKNEILEFNKLLSSHNLTLSDIVDNTPRQARTKHACQQVIKTLLANEDFMRELIASSRLPISKLAKKAHVSKKTIERHRKYIVAIALIYTNGFFHIRDHISQVINHKEVRLVK